LSLDGTKVGMLASAKKLKPKNPSQNNIMLICVA
jgi:hypothetical protein